MKTCRAVPSRVPPAQPPPGRASGVLRLSPLAVLLLAACGGSDDPASPSSGVLADAALSLAAPVEGEANEPLALVVDETEAAVRALEARLATRLIDAANHDSWLCVGEVPEALANEYRLVVDVDGTRRGLDLDGHGLATERAFGWAGIAPDSVLFDYPETGRQTEIASILFDDDHTFRASDGASGTLECLRQRYVDGVPTRGAAPVAPDDVDRDAEAALALVTRVETRRASGGHFWYCQGEGVPSRGYVLAAEGVLDAEPRALIVDVPVVAGGGADGEALPTIDVGAGVGRAFRWLATDGATLVLVPLDADVATGDGAEGTVATALLGDIVFPVDDVFTATDEDGRMLQCLRSPLEG